MLASKPIRVHLPPAGREKSECLKFFTPQQRSWVDPVQWQTDINTQRWIGQIGWQWWKTPDRFLINSPAVWWWVDSYLLLWIIHHAAVSHTVQTKISPADRRVGRQEGTRFQKLSLFHIPSHRRIWAEQLRRCLLLCLYVDGLIVIWDVQRKTAGLGTVAVSPESVNPDEKASNQNSQPGWKIFLISRAENLFLWTSFMNAVQHDQHFLTAECEQLTELKKWLTNCPQWTIHASFKWILA